MEMVKIIDRANISTIHAKGTIHIRFPAHV